MSDLIQIFVQFGSLAGAAALIAVIINLLKTIGVVKDGTAGKWSAGLNLVALVALVLVKVFVPSADIGVLDGLAGQAATALIVILGYLVQIFVSGDVHVLLSNMRIPLAGMSYTRAAYKKK
jgi:hypothetical protein